MDPGPHLTRQSSEQETSRASQQSQRMEQPDSNSGQGTTKAPALELEGQRPSVIAELEPVGSSHDSNGYQNDTQQRTKSPTPSIYLNLEPDHRETPQRRLSADRQGQPKNLPILGQEYDHRKPWTRYPLGYPRFSAFIASDEDKSTTIFRKFQRLSTRNILYLESEMADLEQEQDRLDQESQQDDDLRLSMMSWDLLCLQAAPQRTGLKIESVEEAQRRIWLQAAAMDRFNLAWRIREVLKMYHEALKLESEVLALKQPDRRPLKGTRRIFMPAYDDRRGTGDGSTMLHGAIRTHFHKENLQELCVLSPPVERDRLTRLLEGRLSYFFRIRNDDGLSDFVSHARVSIAVSVISGLLATIFLIGVILGLYWVSNPNAKLGMLSGLTAGFAGSLALFTNARRQDFFASTAAYAAVLVVFVSGNLASGGTNVPLVAMPAASSTKANTSIVRQTSVITSIISQTSTAIITAAQTISSVASSPAPNASASSNSKLSKGAIAGVVLGSVITNLSLAIALFSYLFRRKTLRKTGAVARRKEMADSAPDSIQLTERHPVYVSDEVDCGSTIGTSPATFRAHFHFCILASIPLFYIINRFRSDNMPTQL